jgi:hypothetical protein
MTDAPSAPSMPTLADPGELRTSIAPAPAAVAKPPVAPDAPRGSYEQRREAQDRAAAKPAADAPIDPQAPQAPAAGEKFKIGKFEVSEEQIAGMMQRQAVEDQRRLILPATPQEYKAELPDGLTLPGGVEYKFNPNDPSLIAARNLAHAKGWSQQDFSEALGLFASHVAGEQAALAERSAAEVKKAGTNAPARVDAVRKFVTAEMGEADAKQINALIVTDSMLRYHERMMQKISNQGTASFSQQHRAAPETTGIPGYEKMSFEQRRQAQDQNAARRNSR